MFVPGPVNAQAWLKGRADPPSAPNWQPARIAISCDGQLAHSMGPTLSNGGKTHGYFFTIWRREANGGWKWTYDHGQPVRGEPIVAAAQPEVRQASCENLATAAREGAELLAHMPPHFGKLAVTKLSGSGISPDGSLLWMTYEVTESPRLPHLKGFVETTVLSWNGRTHELAGKDLINLPDGK
jgi:hypothetical protein